MKKLLTGVTLVFIGATASFVGGWELGDFLGEQLAKRMQ